MVWFGLVRLGLLRLGLVFKFYIMRKNLHFEGCALKPLTFGTAYWDGLYMEENMYRPFKDKKMDRTWVRRGTNKKEGPYIYG